MSEGHKNSLGTPAAYRSTKCEERSEPEGRLFSLEGHKKIAEERA